jgi:hypothetical protein
MGLLSQKGLGWKRHENDNDAVLLPVTEMAFPLLCAELQPLSMTASRLERCLFL